MEMCKKPIMKFKNPHEYLIVDTKISGNLFCVKLWKWKQLTRVAFNCWLVSFFNLVCYFFGLILVTCMVTNVQLLSILKICKILRIFVYFFALNALLKQNSLLNALLKQNSLLNAVLMQNFSLNALLKQNSSLNTLLRQNSSLNKFWKWI